MIKRSNRNNLQAGFEQILRREDTLRILFSDEKFSAIDGVHNSQSERVWALNRADADEKGDVKQKQKFSQKVIVWLGACSKGITLLVILDEGTVDHSCYVKNVLPEALKYGNEEVFGDNWTFQQNGANSHRHHLTQE